MAWLGNPGLEHLGPGFILETSKRPANKRECQDESVRWHYLEFYGVILREMAESEVEQVVGRRKSEEEVYTLLFKEVDSEGKGEVAVEALIDFLHQMQLGSVQGQREEVYDSHEDVSAECRNP